MDSRQYPGNYYEAMDSWQSGIMQWYWNPNEAHSQLQAQLPPRVSMECWLRGLSPLLFMPFLKSTRWHRWDHQWIALMERSPMTSCKWISLPTDGFRSRFIPRINPGANLIQCQSTSIPSGFQQLIPLNPTGNDLPVPIAAAAPNPAGEAFPNQPVIVAAPSKKRKRNRGNSFWNFVSELDYIPMRDFHISKYSTISRLSISIWNGHRFD